MVEKAAIAIAIIVFILPIVLTLQEGYNKIAKIGFIIAIIGYVCIVYICPYMLTKVIVYELEDIKKEIYLNDREMLKNVYMTIYRFGFIFLIIGSTNIFVGATIQLFEKRKNIFPFIYRND